MRKNTKFLSLLLCLAMIFSLAGCGFSSGGAEQENNSTAAAADKEHIFEETTFGELNGFLGDNGYVEQIILQDNIIYMVSEQEDDNGYSEHFSSWDLNGSLLSDYEFYTYSWDDGSLEAEDDTDDGSEIHEGSYINNSWISPDGILYYFLHIYFYNDDWSYDEELNYFVAIQNDGTELFRVATTEWGEDYSSLYFYNMNFSAENKLTLISYSSIVTLDMEGNFLSSAEQDNSDQYSSTNLTYNGLPVYQIWDDTWSTCTYMTMDLGTGELVEELDLPEGMNNYTLYDGTNSGYDVIASGSAGVYGYNYGDEDVTLIMNYVDSDIPTTGISDIVFLNEDTFAGYYYDIVNYEQCFSIFTRVDPESVSDKTEITLAMYYADSDVLEKVYEFNQASDTWRVVVTYYSDYDSEADENGGVTKLNNEIVSGDIPDIIYDYGGYYFDLDAYADLGIFTDIYDLIENDPDIELQDYCTNIFEAFETDGSLYQLPARYRILTVLGKTSVFGNEVLTWEKLQEVQEKYPDASVFGQEYTRSNLLTYALQFTYEDYVNEETGECDFTSDDFKNLLEFIAQYPEEIDYNEIYASDEYWANYDTRYINDNVLLEVRSISSLATIHYDYYYEFMEETSAVGFPNDSGTRGVITSAETFAISKSGNVEGAWEFVKTFITENAQMPEDGEYYYSIPVLKAGVEALADRMAEQSYYLDDDGERVYYDDVAYIGDEEIIIEPAAEKEVQRWLDFVYSVNKKSSDVSDDVINIIFEEADAYFSGQKTVDEVCEIIQSRMSMYIGEG